MSRRTWTDNELEQRWQLAGRHRTQAVLTGEDLGKAPYDPDDLDIFAVVDSSGDIYVIPIEAVAGLKSIYLSASEEYRVGSVAGLLN